MSRSLKKGPFADAHLLIAISYLAQDELYQILEVKKHAALWKELGGGSPYRDREFCVLPVRLGYVLGFIF